jgi:signal transduction histidine kinase
VAPPPDPARAAAAARTGPHSAFESSAFEASSFERSLPAPTHTRWWGWRRRALVLAALFGCLGLFSLARWLAAAPHLEGSWESGAQGELLLRRSALPALDALRGHALLALGVPGQPPQRVDALLLQRSQRWQADDGMRARELQQQLALSAALAQAEGTEPLQLHFDDGSSLRLPAQPRGWAGLGLMFWPLSALALVLWLLAGVVLLARPRPRSLLFVAMSLCQAVNLLFMALESMRGLGLPAAVLAADLPVRAALDLATGAAIVHAFALHPRKLPHAGLLAALAWACVPAWGLLVASGGNGLPLWWVAQGGCIALGVVALLAISHSHRLEPNPYALVMRRFATAALATLVLATAVVAIAARLPGASPNVASGASVAWYLFFASLLLFTPFLARSRQVLREFAMLAGISTVATSLDLLFVAVFSLGPFASLAIAVFIALGLYAAARQWLVQHLTGSSMLTTERTFDQLYRAARAVQAQPQLHAQQLAQLLNDLFDPLETLRMERVPVRTRVVGGGSALVVPMRGALDEGAAALALRFAQRGQRLFTLDDARLADRIVDQLRRAVAYDQAVERGRHEERLRIAQDLHDDIGARLLTLMYQAPSPEMEDYIRHTLQDLKTLTRGLAASEHNLSHAAAEWKADLTQRLTAAHVALSWSCNFERDLRLSVVQWSALTRVLRELVSNALYHGHASRIEVAIEIEGTQLALAVADDGRGRDPQSWAHGLGLGGVRKRVKLLGGQVLWRENQPRGIVCEVQVAEFSGRGTAPPG